MRRIVFAVLALAFILPLTAQAQQWDAEQQEVWDAEVACLNAGIDDVAARKACVHPDFMGWGIQQPVPAQALEKDLDHYYAHNTLKVITAVPLHILVEGDLAIMQLMVKQISSLDGGPDEETWVAWTDIMRRDNGVWRWIADHGHMTGNDN